MSGPLPTIEERVPLARHTSLKVGGPADHFAVVREADELAALLRWASEQSLPVRVIGGGSNLLVADEGVDGLVIKVTGMHYRVDEREGGPVLVVDAGATIANVARRISKEGYGALEWATNVPGTVGGAVVNNAGAFGGDTAGSLLAATIVDEQGGLTRLSVDELKYAYRTSVLKRREMGRVAVVEAELRVAHSTAEAAQGLVAKFQAQRTRSQPRQLSAGSVFANPDPARGVFSGRLIEEAGLKGTGEGGAQLSPQHANFIVNAGGATASDVYTLMRLAQDTVFARTGTWLIPEIELLGRWSDEQRRALHPSEELEHSRP